MASNIVTISGMFSAPDGPRKTYFADSPVVIEISGLKWPADSPFTIVRVEIVCPTESSDTQVSSSRVSSSRASQSASYSPEQAAQLLSEMFPNSNAVFYDDVMGYINGATIKQITDSDNVTHNALVVTSYTDLQLPDIEDYYGDLSIYDAEAIMSYDNNEMKLIVELDSTQERCDRLLFLCNIAYGNGQGGNEGEGGSDGEETDNGSQDVNVIGEFKADTGGQTSVSFDISSALRAIWNDFDYSKEVAAAKSAAASAGSTAFAPLGDDYQFGVRRYREYYLRVYTEYLASDDGGVPEQTQYTDKDGNTDIPGGQCCIGGMTEWERMRAVEDRGGAANADVSYHEHKNRRNGDASNKPTDTPERVGSMSITSWVDVQQGGTLCVYYPVKAQQAADRQTPHPPLVLRDSQPYVDFLFLNRRGAIETCSGQTLEAMGINVKVTQYSRTERPSFNPVRSLMAIGQDGRRQWQMSSGYVTREWAEWWAMEFLGGKRKQWWMRYPIGDANGTYVPVIVEPAKQNISIYDRSKQNMPHVDFTVTLALEG